MRNDIKFKLDGANVKVEDNSFKPVMYNSNNGPEVSFTRSNSIVIEWNNLQFNYSIQDLSLDEQEKLKKCKSCKNGRVFNIMVFCDCEECNYQKRI